MSLRDLLEALLRRWPIVVVGAVVTMALGYVSIQDRSVIWSRTEVAFMAPASALYPNSFKTTSEDLIITAGAVAKSITGPGRVTKYASPDANLVGIGVRDGWSIRLPDTGGQWASDYSSQLLVVEVVGPDRDAVERRQRYLVERIAEELDSRQRAAGVDPVNDITVNVAADSTVLHQVGGSRVRALGMTGIIGGGVTLTVVVLLERRSRRRAEDLTHERDQARAAHEAPPRVSAPHGSRVDEDVPARG